MTSSLFFGNFELTFFLLNLTRPGRYNIQSAKASTLSKLISGSVGGVAEKFDMAIGLHLWLFWTSSHALFHSVTLWCSVLIPARYLEVALPGRIFHLFSDTTSGNLA